MAENCNLATLLQKRNLCTKHIWYNGLSLLLFEGQFTLHLLWCNNLVVLLGLKRVVKNWFKLGSEIVSKVGSKAGTKNSILAFLKCMDGPVSAFLKCTDEFVLVSLKCMDGFVWANHSRGLPVYHSYYARKTPKCPI